jgi:hypothetical protein
MAKTAATRMLKRMPRMFDLPGHSVPFVDCPIGLVMVGLAPLSALQERARSLLRTGGLR